MSFKTLKYAALLFLLTLTFAGGANAQQIWIWDYEGNLGKEKIGFTLIGSAREFARGDDLECSYFYVKYLKDIPLRCSIRENGDFVFEELDASGNVSAVIRGKLLKNEIDDLAGVWTNSAKTASLPFTLSLNSSGAISKGRRYAQIDSEDDAEFERRVQEFRDAVLKRDKQKVASFIEFPITVQVNKKPLKIRSRAAFLQNYDRIFRPAFVEAIRQTVPHNMFTKYTGAMLGAGLVWFWGDGKVIAINNY